MIYESGHRNADTMIEELRLGNQQVVATPTPVEPRKARKKGEGYDRENGVGEGASILASAGQQADAGRGQVRRQQHEGTEKCDIVKKGRLVRKKGVGGGTHLQASAGQAGAGWGGGGGEPASPETAPRVKAKLEDRPWPEEPPGIEPRSQAEFS